MRMRNHRTATEKLGAILLIILLVAPSLSVLNLIPTAQAASSPQTTTLYFTDYLSSLANSTDYSNYMLAAFPSLSSTPPMKTKDAQYPPSLTFINTSGKRSLNTNNIVTWATYGWAMYFLQRMGFNLSDIGIPGINLDELEILLPNPLRITEEFQYTGTDNLSINGDIPFTAYFTGPMHGLRIHDNLTVSLYTYNSGGELGFGIPHKVASTTVNISKGLNTLPEVTATLTNVNLTLKPGYNLLASMEIGADERTNLFVKHVNVTRLMATWEKRASRLINTSRPRLQDLGNAILEFFSVLKDFNVTITTQDLVNITNTLKAPRFIYDSLAHPARLTIPALLPGPSVAVTYYLKTGNTLDTTAPSTNSSSSTIRLTTSPAVWNATAPTRNKIIHNATATLYLREPLIVPLRFTLNAALKDGTTIIANATPIQLPRRVGSNPIHLLFTNFTPYELPHDHTLSLDLSLARSPRPAFLRHVSIRYNGSNTPSTLTVTYSETDNLAINATTTPPDKIILPGQNLTFTITVSSKQADTISLAVSNTSTGSWKISIPQTQQDVSAGGTATFTVTATSTDDQSTAYGNTIRLDFTATGKTGIATTTATGSISQAAIKYSVKIVGYPDTLNVQKGENRSFYIVVLNNNTGAVDDTDNYTVTVQSSNNWDIEKQDHISNVVRGTTSQPNVTMIVEHVPKDTEFPSDTLNITVTSEKDPTTSDTVHILVKVQNAGTAESFYEWFKNLAENLGLAGPFGDYAPLILITIIMIIIIFIIIILTLVLTRRNARISTPDLIKEIDTLGTAQFPITIHNITRSAKTYTLTTHQQRPATPWPITITPETITIDGRQTGTALVSIQPSPSTPSGDWCELQVIVKGKGGRPQRLTLLVLVKAGTPILQIQDVTHSPPEFIPGDRVVTSFTIANEGNAPAPTATIRFFLNRKKIATLDCPIPAGGAADIQVPWIAVKGKNTVKVQVKTQ